VASPPAPGILVLFLLPLLLLLLLLLPAAGCADVVPSGVTSTSPAPVAPATIQPAPAGASNAAPTPASTAPADATVAVPVTVTVTDVYDNRVIQAGLRGDWGFACLIQGFGQTILFDTGADAQILLANLRALGLEETRIDLVVLSHEHSDHTGGLAEVARLNPGLTVYCPASFAGGLTGVVQAAGGQVIPVHSPMSPCPGATVTAPLIGDSIAELGLLLQTSRGPVFVTGCAHPGITSMVQEATSLAGRPLFTVLGGFHLLRASAGRVHSVIGELQALGVQACGPAHCTGEEAIALFQEAYGSGFIPMGVGAILEF
jgi:7,8-dihydropterin-6-yl-methyl-4-(beta-D-ribofuranosyl)aminobenzene 5'-phosphate synthase